MRSSRLLFSNTTRMRAGMKDGNVGLGDSVALVSIIGGQGVDGVN